MTITLTDDTTSIDLNPDLFWSDELAYSPVQQTVDQSITGASIVQVAAKVDGRPITLQNEDDSSGWMVRAVIEQLRNWAAVPGQELTLTVHGTARQVIFRHQESGGALTVSPVVHFRAMDDTDNYLATLRFMEI